jgi:hypothetical protein
MQPNQTKTFNSHNINDGVNYEATIMNAGVLPSASNVFIQQAQADAVDSGGYSVAVRTPLVYIRIKNYANRHALGEQLKRWFRPGTRGRYVTTFKDDGMDYFLNCAVVNIVQEQGNPVAYVAQLESPDTNWRAVVADTDTWHVTGTGGTKTINVLGGDETRLSVALTSTTSGVIGYDFQNILQLPAVAGRNYGTRPWCININSAALVTAGKLRADMNDYRILIDGAQTNRWIVGKNTSNTKIWFNAPIGRGEQFALKTAIAATGAVTYIQFDVTNANKAALARMPVKSIVNHGTEWFSYNGVDTVNCRLKLIGRSLYGTTPQLHAVGSVFTIIPHMIATKYGNAIATDPSLADVNYDYTKPIFDLSLSDNTQWVYTAATKFYDPARPYAPGSWRPVLQRLGDVSNYYSIKGNAESGDPALGSLLACFLKNGAAQTETGKVGFLLTCPGGFSEISMTGRKYSNRSSGRWPAKAGCQRSDTGATYYPVFNEAAPATLSTYITFTQTAVAVATTSTILFIGLEGTISASAGALAMLEGLTVTVKFFSANLPSAALLGETGNYSLDETLENTTIGDQILLDYPMLRNAQMVLDGENFTVTYYGHPMSGAMRLDDEGRSVWMRLQPGNNVLSLTSPDLGTQDLALSWYRRRT